MLLLLHCRLGRSAFPLPSPVTPFLELLMETHTTRLEIEAGGFRQGTLHTVFPVSGDLVEKSGNTVGGNLRVMTNV